MFDAARSHALPLTAVENSAWSGSFSAWRELKPFDTRMSAMFLSHIKMIGCRSLRTSS
jgi:hypothetical protein